MPLLRTSAAELTTRFANPRDLAEHMVQQASFEGLGAASPAEVRSWEKSVPELAKAINAAGLGDVTVLLEHQLPLTSKRVDAILAGTHPTTGEPSYVIVELKQWSTAHSFEDNPELVDVPGTLGAPRSHPILQVDDYRSYLTSFATILEDHPEQVHGAVYLHNADSRLAVADLDDLVADSDTKLFTGGDVTDFGDYLRARLALQADPQPADDLQNTSLAPSRLLLEKAASEIREREEFILLDRQRDALKLILHTVGQAQKSDNKRVIVVSGGPGSGKSVVALSALGELSRQGKRVMHATGSNAFTETYKRVAGHRHKGTQQLFKYFNSFTNAEKHSLDVLIADESHRIRETSTNRFTPAAQRAAARPQIDELIDVARTPVFLLDEYQVVRPGEMGSLFEITRFAEAKGLEVVHVELTEQFRCGGSIGYTNWVEGVLGLDAVLDVAGVDQDPADVLESTVSLNKAGLDYADLSHIQVRRLNPVNPPMLPVDPNVEVSVADSPQEMEDLLRQKMDQGYSARISAGYCWRWNKVTKGDTELREDVTLGSWTRPWNNPESRAVGAAPPRFRWATAKGGFEQVGCVYTAQGFEYDWSGVIIGPDMVWRDGDFVTVREGNADPALSRNKLSDHDFDILVRHIYKVLLTRGMQGTVIYSPDRQTREVLKHLVGQDNS
ncbi:DNA/RNA helicase domain-containing protein [Corynebacterium sp.]|uniref:DNA/RNA helicase domain-containing protein n=1 Tax=Corynebacterium sp. TaxID=1720 RepID=UPI003461C065